MSAFAVPRRNSYQQEYHDLPFDPSDHQAKQKEQKEQIHSSRVIIDPPDNDYEVQALFGDDIENEEPLSLEQTPWKSRGICCGNFVSLAGAVSLFALAVLRDYGLGVNALMTLSLGFLTFFPVVSCLPTKIQKGVKDSLMDYGSPFFYFIVTQLLINLPSSPLKSRLGYGVINFACGSQLAAQIHNIVGWKVEHDYVAKPDASLRLLSNREIQNYSPIENDHRIPVLFGSRARSRLIMDGAKGAIGIGSLILGSQTTSLTATAAFKLGYILLGYTGGCIAHEGIRSLTRKYEKKCEETGTRSFSLYLLRLIGKIEAATGFLLPGIIGFNTPYSNVASGFFVGLLNRIHWIRFTRTPVSQLDELLIDDNQIRSKCKMMTNVVLGIFCWLPFCGWQLAKTSTVERAALATFTGASFLSFLSGRLLDQYNIINGKNRFKNTLVFNAHQLINPPIIFISITQVMKIGSQVLNNYPVSNAVLACVAWADLGRIMGSHAAHNQTLRKRRYPAQLNTSIMLYTYFLAQQIEASIKT